MSITTVISLDDRFDLADAVVFSLKLGERGLPSGNVTEAEICDWCTSYLTTTFDNPAIVITRDATFAEMGLDSASSAYFVVELEEWLGLELSPELVFDYPTIAQLARYLVAQKSGG